MKKKNLFLISILAFVLFLPIAHATGSYYETDEGTYMICGGSEPRCREVVKGQTGVQFNLKYNEIIVDGVVYYYNSIEQENYNETLNGKTRMFYYIDTKERYVLCDTLKSCKTYTFDKLVDNGAIINNPYSITLKSPDGPGEKGIVYYFSQEQQDKYLNGNEDGNGSNQTGNSGQTITESDTCTRLKEPFKFIGNVLLVFKIVIPIIIIIFGMIDFFKAIVGSKDDEMKKSLKSLIFRCIAGIIIFLIPTIISVIFSLIDSWADIKGEFNACQRCIFNVSKCK